MIILKAKIIEESRKIKYLTSKDPKIATIIQRASDYCLKKNAGIYRRLEEYDRNYDSIPERRFD